MGRSPLVFLLLLALIAFALADGVPSVLTSPQPESPPSEEAELAEAETISAFPRYRVKQILYTDSSEDQIVRGFRLTDEGTAIGTARIAGTMNVFYFDGSRVSYAPVPFLTILPAAILPSHNGFIVTSRTVGQSFWFDTSTLSSTEIQDAQSRRVVLLDVNDAGIAVGESNTSGSLHAIRFNLQTRERQDLGTLGGTESSASLINTRGEIGGWSKISPQSTSMRAFLYIEGSGMRSVNEIKQLNVAQWNFLEIFDLTENGDIVGLCRYQRSVTIPCRIPAGSSIPIALEIPEGMESCYPSGTNTAGWTVGTCYPLVQDGFPPAYLWSSAGDAVELSRILEAREGLIRSVNLVADINEKGDLVIDGVFDLDVPELDSNGQLSAILEVVCPADYTGSSDPSHEEYGIPDGITDYSDFAFFMDTHPSKAEANRYLDQFKRCSR